MSDLLNEFSELYDARLKPPGLYAGAVWVPYRISFQDTTPNAGQKEDRTNENNDNTDSMLYALYVIEQVCHFLNTVEQIQDPNAYSQLKRIHLW